MRDGWRQREKAAQEAAAEAPAETKRFRFKVLTAKGAERASVWANVEEEDGDSVLVSLAHEYPDLQVVGGDRLEGRYGALDVVLVNGQYLTCRKVG